MAMRVQDAPVRRPILAVSDSTAAGNLLVFDSQGSAVLPKGAPEIEQIRCLIAQAANKLMMQQAKGIYTLDAWVDPPRPFARSGKA